MWIPIGHGRIESQARESIYDIANVLQTTETSSLSPFTLCEHALLYAYLGLDKQPQVFHDQSVLCLQRAIDALAAAPYSHLRYELYGGLAGIAWLIQHTSKILGGGEEGINNDEDDPLLDLDARLLNLNPLETSLGSNYDLIFGLAGLGVYWLERLPRSDAVLGIRRTVDALERIATHSTHGITWFTPPCVVPSVQSELAPRGYYNLGVAHGVPGVISYLSIVATLDLNEDLKRRATRMFEGATEWLLAQQRMPSSVSRYGSWVTPDGASSETRLSWCYGDLGIAAVLRTVADRTQSVRWNREADALSIRCLMRSSSNTVKDAGLCHGALGIAHIFNRMYQSTRESDYRDAALDWAVKGLAYRRPGIGLAGYFAYDGKTFPHGAADPSFLSGAVGVALGLLSLITPIEPCWDRLLLLSGPNRTENGSTH